jgi:hypothetical protein
MSNLPTDSSAHLPPTHQRAASLGAPAAGSPIPNVAEQMQQRILALEARLQQTKVQTVKKPSIPPPKAFTGETTGAGGYNQIDDWIEDVEKNLRHNADYFTSDALVMDYASSYLSGKAHGWWKSTQEERRSSGQQITTWVAMKEELLERFHPIEAATLARMALDKMTQKGSVQSYAEYFYKQMNYIKDMSVADQLHHFTRGLKSAIRAEVLKARPTTIHQAVIVANTQESLLNMSHSQPKYTARSYGSVASSGGSVPMELGNINQGTDDELSASSSSGGSASASTLREQQLLSIISELQKQNQLQQSINAMFGGNGNRNGSNRGGRSRRSNNNTRLVPNVSKEDYERCRAESLCINCKQSGHVAKECTNAFSLKF